MEAAVGCTASQATADACTERTREPGKDHCSIRTPGHSRRPGNMLPLALGLQEAPEERWTQDEQQKQALRSPRSLHPVNPLVPSRDGETS